MKISQLVATKTKTPYYESVASRLPRGIKTQKQLFNLGYQIAVEDLGLAKAKTLNENFAAKMVNSYHNQCLNEGVGSFLGKAAGHVAGAVGAAGRGIKSAWNDAKAGYAAAKGSWDPSSGAPAPAGGTAPAAGGTAPVGRAAPSPGGATPTPPSAGTPPTTGSSGGIGDIMKAIDGLDPASKKQLAGELEKSINTPEPAADPNSGTKTGTTNPGDWAADGRNASAADHAAPADVKPAAGTPTPAAPTQAAAGTPAPAAPQGQALDLDQLKKDREAKLAAGQAGQQQAQQQMAATAQSNAATNQQDAAIKAAADAAKAKSGFQQTAADKLAIKQAADKGIREEEEIAEGFHSNFLGMKI